MSKKLTLFIGFGLAILLFRLIVGHSNYRIERENAVSMACKSQRRMYAVACQMYAKDHGDQKILPASPVLIRALIEGKYLGREFKCHGGGTYTFASLNDEFKEFSCTCSIHGMTDSRPLDLNHLSGR